MTTIPHFRKVRPAPYFVLAVKLEGQPYYIEFGSHAGHEVVEEKAVCQAQWPSAAMSIHKLPSESGEDMNALLVRLNKDC
jgi:uncharacterized ParB-like nuclease family protein